ncbi:ABC transporter ATP-binding protein [Rahnella sp. L72c]|uniref:Glutathione import ATP-binding protein GsiA n=1 Tax=Rahnella perminowiae TaxID=2816244 RepID=A0ABS6L0T7_9GAMM|nr:ABC transporter ATP-binding protein [Rahnella perminowiae]MBU9835452.1 ABC transporter ATP-binding protein [Rahnella perminowiae]
MNPTRGQPENRQPVLSVKHLTTSFRGEDDWLPVVRDLSFDVYPGETLAIVGESGSGKSVTSLSVMRLLKAQGSKIEGEVWLNQRSLLALSDKQMRDIRGNDMAMIFQEPMTSLNPTFSIGRQIAESLKRHRGMSSAQARAETLRLLEKVRIPNANARFDEYPHQFSGGMRQRVMIAMALALKPKLLIADEPTTALDVTIQGQILDLIKTLQEEEGMAVLFITHDMGVVAEIADRTLVMYRGEAVESGVTEDIFHRPQHPYTRALLAAVPTLGSMQGRAWPLRFPQINLQTGETREPKEVAETVGSGLTPLLSVKNLSARFPVYGGIFSRQVGAVHAVENISFDLYPGETLSLVGESGCGKSTTGRAVTRLLKPHSGAIDFDGFDVMNLGRRDILQMRQRIQMIFQDPFASLNPRMRIGDALIEPMLQHKLHNRSDAKEKAASLLQKVGLSPDMLRRFPHEFSGGQRQRICIARALTLDPKVIVADESVSALDVSVKAQVVNLLLDLQESMHLSYLFISHDMAVVERVSHRVAVMYLGEIVEIGPRAAIFDNPQHAYTRKLMASVPVPDPSRRMLKRQMQVDELKSPVRDNGYIPPQRQYQEVSAGHFVQV